MNISKFKEAEKIKKEIDTLKYNLSIINNSNRYRISLRYIDLDILNIYRTDLELSNSFMEDTLVYIKTKCESRITELENKFKSL